MEVRGVLIVKCCSIKTAPLAGLKRILICILFIFTLKGVNAIEPGRNLISLSISVGMKSLFSIELGYEYTLTDIFAPQISLSYRIIGKSISLEVNMNCYIGYLHLSTPFNFGFSKPEHEWLPYINFTPELGLVINNPYTTQGFAIINIDFGWTFPLIFDSSSFMSKGGFNFQGGVKGQLF